jgi:hypothetical protein
VNFEKKDRLNWKDGHSATVVHARPFGATFRIPSASAGSPAARLLFLKFREWLIRAPSVPSTDSVAPKFPSTLSAWYWNGGTSIAAKVREISDSGGYLYTSELWYPGTILTTTFTFQRGSGKNGAKSADSLTLPCKVTGHEQDGMRVSFMCIGPEERKALRLFIERVPCGESPLPFRRERGRSLVEFGLIVQLVFLLIINAVNCGGFIYGWTNRKTGNQVVRYPGQVLDAGTLPGAQGRAARSGLAEK